MNRRLDIFASNPPCVGSGPTANPLKSAPKLLIEASTQSRYMYYEV